MLHAAHSLHDAHKMTDLHAEVLQNLRVDISVLIFLDVVLLERVRVRLGVLIRQAANLGQKLKPALDLARQWRIVAREIQIYHKTANLGKRTELVSTSKNCAS